MIVIEEMDITKRFINFVRGVAILLMLWGHSIQYCSQGSFDFLKTRYLNSYIVFICHYLCLLAVIFFGFHSAKEI